VPSIILYVDGIDLRVKWTNRFAQEYVPQQDGTDNLIGKSLDDIIPGLQAIGISQMFREVARTGRPHYVNELRLPGIRPEPSYWRGSIIPLQGEGAEVPDLLIMAVDVTGQVEARVCAEGVLAQAKEEKERLHTILETLPIGAAMLDRAGRVVEMNAAAIALWTTIVPSFTDLKDLESVQAWTNGGDPMRMDDWGMSKAALQGMSTINEVVTLRRYDGREMIMMMSSTPLLDSSRRVLGAVVIGQDLTNQMHVQKEMVVSREREELYLDILNHDIVNLNASAMGYLQLLLGQGELIDKERGWARGTLDALEESSRLIESVRGLHELEAGKHDLEVIDVDQVLRRTVDEFVPHPARDIEVQMSSRGEHCVLGTPMVQEVFANIIDNAIKHSDGKLSILIGVTTVFETGREYHRIEVSDDGPGIPPQLRENIFTRAWRGRTKGVGKGLGLFLVRRLVEEMEGRVWAEDRIPGFPEKGVKIIVLLPAVTCLDNQARNGT
jgi:signal transduction histidine kinase